MRIGLVVVAFGIVGVGCGGKVVVDTPNGGGGGAGGTTVTTGAGGGGACIDTTCGAASDGSCACDGVCNEQHLQVKCTPIQGGASCTCVENDIKIGVCVQAGAATCDFFSECCAAHFFGQAGGG